VTPASPAREKKVEKKNMTFGQRLRDERRRLGLSQVQCAELCGVVEKTQGLYEASVRRPDTDYLESIAKAGADVHFLITGAYPSTTLTEEERTLLSLFRQSDAVGREIILATVSVTEKKLQDASRAPRSANRPTAAAGTQPGPRTSKPRS
jgi:transcriptional regulator with XRE-family HTH domain